MQEFVIDEHIKNSLKEDIGYGDITTDFLYNEADSIVAKLNTRQDCVVCGIDVMKRVFAILSPDVKVSSFFKDGDIAKKGDTIADVASNFKTSRSNIVETNEIIMLEPEQLLVHKKK